MTIIHIFEDQKFADKAIECFSEFSEYEQEFYTYTNERKFIRSKRVAKITAIELREKVMQSDKSCVIFHSLEPRRYKFLRQIKSKATIVWIGWGYDYYFLRTFWPIKKYLLPETEKQLSFNWYLKATYQDAIRLLRNNLMPHHLISPLKKVRFFAPVIRTEADLVARSVKNFQPIILDWNYPSGVIQGHEGFSSQKRVSKKCIVGNSGSLTNNHFDTIRTLEEKLHLFQDVEFILPLSYGDSNNRKKILKKLERSKLKYMILNEFIPSEDYIEIMKSCDSIIFNHIRQEGLGNIVFALANGICIYLNSESFLYTHLKNLGAVIHKIEDFSNTPLEIQDKVKNREIALKHWGPIVQRKRTEKLLKEIIHD